MKRAVIAAIALLILTACSIEMIHINKTQKPNVSEEIVKEFVKGTPEFEIVHKFAKRNPAFVNGTVKNIGEGTGSVKIIAKVYYAHVIATERSQILENIMPGEKANFHIPIDETVQWHSYFVIAEKI